MEIISHRGYWLKPEEKNSKEAFQRSFNMGFGTETDIRDYRGGLVISHDVPNGHEMSFEEFLYIYKSSGCQGTLALNIKADGLQELIQTLLMKYQIANYFVFDMAVPDLRLYLKNRIKAYTRHSDVEIVPSFLKESSGVWVDSLKAPWLTDVTIDDLTAFKKPLCFVSPELHGRDPISEWSLLKKYSHMGSWILCTDFPEKALEYFGRLN